MPAPVVGRRPRLVPPKSATIDRSHPLAQGLAFCNVPSLGYDDIVYGYKATVSGTPKPATTSFGPSISSDPGTYGNYWTYAGLPSATFTGAMTLMWVGAYTQTWASGGQQLVGKNPNSSTNANKSIHCYTQFNRVPVFLRANSSGGIFINSPTSAIGVGDPTVMIVTTGSTMTTGSTIDWWMNGVFSSPTPGFTTGSVADNGGLFVISGNGVEGTYGYPTVNIVALWSRRMSHAEAQQLTADPFCFLKV